MKKKKENNWKVFENSVYRPHREERIKSAYELVAKKVEIKKTSKEEKGGNKRVKLKKAK